MAIDKAGIKSPPPVVESSVQSGRHHRYQLGDKLSMAGSGRTTRVSGVCTVAFLLPFEGTRVLYRVQADGEGFQRVVAESELSPL
jgi:hypothetical protein